jgi:HSP20 family molecular chaperone IbpA
MSVNNQIPNIVSYLLENNMNSSFAEQMSDILSTAQSGGIDNLWKPNIDLIEIENYLYVFATLPGVDPDTVDVDFFNNFLKGDRKFPDVLQEETTISSRRQEIIYGKFERKVALPISVTRNESVNVSLDNGILCVKIDKSIESSNRFNIRLNKEDNTTS